METESALGAVGGAEKGTSAPWIVPWIAGISVFSWTMTPWMVGLTILKESPALIAYPPRLYWFILDWYFPILNMGLASWAIAGTLLLVAWAKNWIRPWTSILAVVILTASWFIVGACLIANNIENLREGYPFHWPHGDVRFP